MKRESVTIKKTLMKFIVILFLCIISNPSVAEEGREVPRVIIALYDSIEQVNINNTMIHQLAQMPLNHLGLKLEYYDVQAELPDVKNRKDVRGVISWFSPGTKVRYPKSYLAWASDIIDSGKKFVIIGATGFYENTKKENTSIVTINRFLKKLGLKDGDVWVNLTYDVEFIHKDKNLLDFEREVKGFLNPYEKISVISKSVKSYLVARKDDDPDTDSHIITISPSGAYVAEGYAFYYDPDEKTDIRQWYINPFEFFRLAFETDDLPKPDTSTIAGRRIYYSHIDGDGWNNITLLEEYRKKNVLSSKVILDKVIREYPDLPITVGVIAAEIDEKWVGTKESRAIARDIMALKHVEAGTHTYSHPMKWSFFEDGNVEKERPFLQKYPFGSWNKSDFFDVARDKITSFFSDNKKSDDIDIKADSDLPRAYANKKFDINLEIAGSIKTIEEILPPEKKVEIIQWSGDTQAFEKAIELSRLQGITNINGGDSRFDREYPSYAWVSPIGRQVGSERQIYASNSNENTYTDLWTDKFYGFKNLVRTIKNTEIPIRIKPFNVYYHMYSGERQASLNALLDNLNYARVHKIAPVTTSYYSKIANGFYDTKITSIGDDSWRIDDSDVMSVIRFDNATLKTVDFEKSKGIVGQKHFHGSLYVYMDELVDSKIITLKKHKNYFREAIENTPYLIDSRWRIYDLRVNSGEFSFIGEGFGDGEMLWSVPKSGKYKVSIDGEKSHIIEVNSKKSLHIRLNGVDAINPIKINVEYASQ